MYVSVYSQTRRSKAGRLADVAYLGSPISFGLGTRCLSRSAHIRRLTMRGERNQSHSSSGPEALCKFLHQLTLLRKSNLSTHEGAS